MAKWLQLLLLIELFSEIEYTSICLGRKFNNMLNLSEKKKSRHGGGGKRPVVALMQKSVHTASPQEALDVEVHVVNLWGLIKV